MIKLNQVSKKYNNHEIIKNTSFVFSNKKIYGIVGKNGAGKTTLLKLMTNVAMPTTGTVVRDKGLIGCSFGLDYYEDLTVEKNLLLRKSILGIKEDTFALDLMKETGLWDHKSKKAKDLSLGLKQLLDISLAFVGNPNIIILDEPFNGLDPMNLIIVRDKIKTYFATTDCLMIISSHGLAELEKLASEFLIINDGKILDAIDHSDITENDSLETIFQAKIMEGR